MLAPGDAHQPLAWVAWMYPGLPFDEGSRFLVSPLGPADHELIASSPVTSTSDTRTT
ncbi:hypothetical protein VFPBJ_01154 [Purpureocillium lilacinum]|uniref:Uncharacterized protein n=1 Tax=Purpureocillium lilacinum TaxID=33203 RepID=A0A179HAE4_PURLI|nr:hypothetical protein VFPBJ_01154 [Purpureocillium lilacinum]